MLKGVRVLGAAKLQTGPGRVSWREDEVLFTWWLLCNPALATTAQQWEFVEESGAQRLEL